MSAKIEIEPELARDGQEQEGRDDREAADQERQRRCDQAPEEEQREQEENREGEELRPLKIGLDVLVDLLLRDRVAADEDVVIALELGDQGFAGVLERVVLGRFELDGHVGGLAVLRDERAGLRLEKARDAAHALDAGRPLPRPRDPLGALGGGGVRVLDEDDRLRVAVARRLELLLRDERFLVRIVGAVGVEAVSDAGAERTGKEEEDPGEDQNALGVAAGEVCESVHHRVSPFGS